jgi:hypothetical protein
MQHIHVKDSLDSSSQKLLDSSSMVCTIPQSWTAPAALHLACSTLSHSSSCTFSSQLDSSFSSPPRLLQQLAAAGQLLDNSFSSCSFWQHLQGAEPLLDSSMGCTCPHHQQHLQGSRMGRHSTAGTATHPRQAAPPPHGKLSLDSSCSSCKGQQQPILASPHTAAWRQ